jgi:Tol biopolymer transport system component
LLAFASNRLEDVYSQIYRVTLDGRRLDVGGSLEGDWGPQPSPDGSRLAFWSNRPGGGLLVSDADGSHPVRMQLPLLAQPLSTVVAWSPDSKRLALAYEPASDSSQTRVGVFEARSGAETPLGSGQNPTWSPDGSRIAVTDATSNGYGIYVERPDGSGRVLVSQGSSPVWSPDGAHLLVVGNELVVPAVGGAAVSLGRFNAVAWTPDSARILATLTTHSEIDLWSLAADGSDPQRIAENVYDTALSPDGQRLVFLHLGDILITDLAGHVLHDLGRWHSGPSDLHMQLEPSWSPDGTKLLYWSGGKVFVADANSGEVRAVAGGRGERTDDPGRVGPVWSADGSSVYVTITDTRANTDIYVARPDGSHLRAVVADPVPDGGPVWSPDGTRFAFIRYGSPPSLVVTGLGGHERVLLRSPRLVSRSIGRPPLSRDGSGWPGAPSWSPDGKTIAVASSSGILLIDVRTRAVRHWTRDGADLYPAWSADGTIAYTDGLVDTDQDSSIWVTGTKSKWTLDAAPFSDEYGNELSGIAANLAWSPDGSKLAFTRYGIATGTNTWAVSLDSIRIVDRRTHRARLVPTDSWSFAWSPDGRYIIQGGLDANIITTTGRPVAILTHLRALHPSWQPLCQHRAALSH